MEFLFDNPLANLKGPMFLALYVVFIFTILIAYSIVKFLLDKTSSLSLPTIPQNPDAYEIAYLRGGANEVARSVIFSLRQKGLVKIETVGNQYYIAPTAANKTARLTEPIEQAASDWLKFSREPKEVFSASGLAEMLQPYCDNYERNLQRKQLLADESLQNTTSMLKAFAMISIVLLGLYKFIAALNHGRSNVLFLVLAGIIGLIVVYFFAKPARITKLGKLYLAQLETAFDRLRMQVQSARPVAQSATFAGVDPILLSVGIFGSSVLAGSIYNDHNDAFQKSQAGSWSGSGCGSSSCNSSTCSSGGDGGSSCGGGGCGGCGGGCS
jgi:uncharacterized protein (TIGR04222 family)